MSRRNDNPDTVSDSPNTTVTLGRPLLELAAALGASTRLLNALLAASQRPHLGLITLSDYLHDIDDALTKVSRLKSVGGKTISELQKLIVQCAEQTGADVSALQHDRPGKTAPMAAGKSRSSDRREMTRGPRVGRTSPETVSFTEECNLKVGEFARSGSNALGVGRIKEVDAANRICRIEYFVSPAGPVLETRDVPMDQVKSVELPTETLIYWYDDSELAWRIGRIQGEVVDRRALKSASEDHYPVRFPNGVGGMVPVSEICVRWNLPLEDPTDLLAARVTESAFFVEGRRKLGGFIARQRRAFSGMLGLGSAAIEYHQHQVAVVRRILEDPVQRYILADEVGLGKTIEAGILIRQHVLQYEEQARVCVIVPDHLQEQWRDELERKFFQIDDEQVFVVTESDLDTPRVDLTMLVVDEAHHASRWAFSEDEQSQDRYAELASRASDSDSVLLLSATPVLNEEDGFLAMLHLIDPDAHPLEDRAAFRARVRGRQAVANSLADLSEDAPELFLEDVLTELTREFSDDGELLARCAAVQSRLSEDEACVERMAAIRDLRAYIAETYRLHRRLLRTRRDDPLVTDLLPERCGIELISIQDEARRAAAEFLEDWRAKIPSGEIPDESSELFATWVTASLSHPVTLRRCIKERIQSLAESGPAAFESESQLLSEWERELSASLESGEPRARAIAEWCETNKKRAIVFTDDHEAAERVCMELSERWGADEVARCEPDDDSELSRFIEAQSRVLVVDRASEEGLNLQEIRAGLFLFDCPFSPTRLEQRIGRVDRLEGLRNLKFMGFEPVGEYENALLGLMRDAAKVFDRSVAPLQYALGEAVARIECRLLEYGPAAITEETSRLTGDGEEGLEAEFRRIRAQEALDSFERDLEEETKIVDGMNDAADEAFSEGREALESWLNKGLHFEFRGKDEFHIVHREPGRFSRRPTLIPLRETIDHFSEYIDRDASDSRYELPFGPFTFDREMASESGAAYLGIGNSFLTAVEAQLRGDVRGVAWAFWRQSARWELSEPGMFFRFDFATDLEVGGISTATALRATNADTAMRVLADATYAPIRKTVWVGLDEGVITDPELLRTLEAPYTQTTDTNLRPERWIEVEEQRPITDWHSVVGFIRKQAETGLRSDSEITDSLGRARRNLARSLKRTEDVIKSRAGKLTGAARDAEANALESERQINAVLSEAVEKLRVRVDSAGLIVLAKEPFPS